MDNILKLQKERKKAVRRLIQMFFVILVFFLGAERSYRQVPGSDPLWFPMCLLLASFVVVFLILKSIKRYDSEIKSEQES